MNHARALSSRHPRLFFTAGELARLRAEAKSGFRAVVLRQLRHACMRLMDPHDPWYLDFRERRTDTWRERKGIFLVLPSLTTLAVGYAFTGDKRVGDFARDALMAIVEHGLADVKTIAFGSKYQGWRHGPGHDKGNFAQSAAYVYDFCYDRFTSRQRARLAAYAKESIRFAGEWQDFDQAQVSNNRGVRGILANTWWCLAFEGDTSIPGSSRWYQQGLIAAEKYLFMAYDRDGAPYEGPGYASSLSRITAVAEALRRRGQANLIAHNRFERFPEYLLYEMIPGGGSANNLNDCHPECGSLSGSLPLLGTPRGALLPWLLRRYDLHPSRLAGWRVESRQPIPFPMGEWMLHCLLWWTDAPIREPRSLGYPLSRCFPTRGVASMRTGWDKNDWLVSHFCGRQERSLHRQGDYNHVALYALGERFLIDAGYGGPHGDFRKKADRWFGLTSAHNCVRVDRMEQRGVIESPGWAEGEMLDFRHTPAFDTSLGDASSTTGRDHRVRRSLRRVVFVRRAPRPYVAVVDVNEKDGGAFLAEALWHTQPGNRFELDGKRFWIRGNTNDCYGELLWPRGAKRKVGKHHQRPQLRVAVRTRVAEMVTVFCPLRRGEQPPRFSVKRKSEGRFVISCRQGGKVSRLEASAVIQGRLRQPMPVRIG